MKYLKKFNESKSLNINDIKNFCDSYLAYLYDEGFKTIIYDDEDSELINIQIIKEGTNNWSFLLSDIIEYFIPFITILSQKYSALSNETISFHSYSSNDYFLSVEDIINGNISDEQYNNKLANINIKIWRFSDINESVNSNDKVLELKEYCESYLSYIMEYFNLTVTGPNGNKRYIIINRKGGRTFRWERIKDYFIPFYTMLMNDYNVIDNIKFYDWCEEFLNFKSNDIIDDNVEEINNTKVVSLQDIDLSNLVEITFGVEL